MSGKRFGRKRKKSTMEAFGTLLDSERKLHSDRNAAIVSGLLQPLVREITFGRVFALTYRGGDRTEWVRIYMSDGKSAVDVEVTGMDTASLALEVLSESISPCPVK